MLRTRPCSLNQCIVHNHMGKSQNLELNNELKSKIRKQNFFATKNKRATCLLLSHPGSFLPHSKAPVKSLDLRIATLIILTPCSCHDQPLNTSASWSSKLSPLLVSCISYILLNHHHEICSNLQFRYYINEWVLMKDIQQPSS